jgi:hypothetical protein
MAKKSGNNKLLLIAAVGAAAYYLYTRHPAAAAPPVVQTSGGTAPNYGTGSNQTPAPVTVADPRLTEINQWVSTLSTANAAAARNALTVMSQGEIASLYDIVHNDFYGNGITTATQRDFWNVWRTKYHVNDGTYQ